ncbi:MAG: hypothetical protein WD556_10435 [Actinomycetota bacterium]
MRIETRLRDALQEGVADIGRSEDAWRSIQSQIRGSGETRTRHRRGRAIPTLVASLFLALLLSVPLWLLLPLGDDSERGRLADEAAATALDAEGVSLAVPDGWHGRADSLRGYTRRIFQVATFPLPPLSDIEATDARDAIGPQDILIVLSEYIHVSDDLPDTSGLPILLEPADLEPRQVPKWMPALHDVPADHALARRIFRVPPTSDPDHVPPRYFDLRVEFGSDTVRSEDLSRANAVLGSLAVGEWMPEPNDTCQWNELGMLDPDCPQGRWLREVLHTGGFTIADDGGTFVARSGGAEFSIWTEEADRVPKARLSLLEDRDAFPIRETVGTVTVHGSAESWDWDTDRMHVYVAAGPYGDSKFPSFESIVPLVRASVDVPYPSSTQEGRDGLEPTAPEDPTKSTAIAFAPNEGWRTAISTIDARSDADELSVAWAANVPFRSESDGSGFPSETIRTLPADGIVLTAVEPRPYTGSERFPQLRAPVDLSQGACAWNNYEMQASPDVSRCGIDTIVDGELLNVSVWFGVNHPGELLFAEANQELEHLQIPT